MKRYQVEYIDPNTGAQSPVDVITVDDSYTPDDYRADMELSWGGEHGDGEYIFEPLPLFWIVDDCLTRKAAVYTEAVMATDIDDAARIGRTEWDKLTAHDKGLRDAFYVCLAWADEDGELDFDRIEAVQTIPVPEQKKFRVLPEYHDQWTNEYIPELIVTEAEIERLAGEWGTDIETLMEQVEEVD